ncbi:MAG: gamma-glutamylcyclotransferase [Acidimicrobiia bacterium]|nr:gamma-glutamylcyclotransferase [Acidimicrobiia bacterium]
MADEPARDYLFFYGTLMSRLGRSRPAGVDRWLTWLGCGTIKAQLFDLGTYPGAVPSETDEVRGELHACTNPGSVLPVLDEFEQYRPDRPAHSLFVRTRVLVLGDDAAHTEAWAYFYNAAPGEAPRIDPGDYLSYLLSRARKTSLPEQA